MLKAERRQKSRAGNRKIVIGPALRNASRCGGSELPGVVHPRCSAKNTPSATAGTDRRAGYKTEQSWTADSSLTVDLVCCLLTFDPA